MEHDDRGVFRGLPQPLTATRYHSLIVEENSCPPELEISARVRERGGKTLVMGLRHKRFPIEGVQFHPESVLTESGRELLRNFLEM